MSDVILMDHSSQRYSDRARHSFLMEQYILSRLLFGKALVEPEVILAEVEKRWGCWKMLAAHLLKIYSGETNASRYPG